MKLAIVIFLIIGVVMALFINFANNQNLGQNEVTSSNEIITSDVSDMIPLINDENLKIEKESENYIKAVSTFNFQYDVMELDYEIFKFSSIEEALDKYNSVKDDYSEYKNTKINLGNEGFGIEKEHSSIVIFRKSNIVIKVLLDGQYSSLEQTITYAKRVRI